MNYWDSVGRWINTVLVFVVGVLAFDALFRLLEANEDNVIVAFVQALAVLFLLPFRGMFGEQDYILTALVGVLGYALFAGIALGVLRSVQASLARPAPPVRPEEDRRIEEPRRRRGRRIVEDDGDQEATGRRGARRGRSERAAATDTEARSRRVNGSSTGRADADADGSRADRSESAGRRTAGRGTSSRRSDAGA